MVFAHIGQVKKWSEERFPKVAQVGLTVAVLATVWRARCVQLCGEKKRRRRKKEETRGGREGGRDEEESLWETGREDELRGI